MQWSSSKIWYPLFMIPSPLHIHIPNPLHSQPLSTSRCPKRTHLKDPSKENHDNDAGSSQTEKEAWQQCTKESNEQFGYLGATKQIVSLAIVDCIFDQCLRQCNQLTCSLIHGSSQFLVQCDWLTELLFSAWFNSIAWRSFSSKSWGWFNSALPDAPVGASVKESLTETLPGSMTASLNSLWTESLSASSDSSLTSLWTESLTVLSDCSLISSRDSIKARLIACMITTNGSGATWFIVWLNSWFALIVVVGFTNFANSSTLHVPVYGSSSADGEAEGGLFSDAWWGVAEVPGVRVGFSSSSVSVWFNLDAWKPVRKGSLRRQLLSENREGKKSVKGTTTVQISRHCNPKAGGGILLKLNIWRGTPAGSTAPDGFL